ncbi:GHMP kinase [Halogeometricum sp. S1BR25-6]|uniref:Pantoate kinase n=1 Tax=Halogeometricum salsisoli TaxID=2950536 RepID=A0ABU2GGL1_9EURY|nr:GHMP kinase [Halogeometricum sp. S1BR25-6]MDS0299951.1 GHMP kinase [Halogeometricum sp. S1BR25-6]
MPTAYAPGSVTTVFAPREDGEGSYGVSFAVADGVRATVDPADETTVRLDGEPTDFEPVAGVLDSLDVAATVDLDAEIPVGRGFGASGAATLATVLAADAAFELDLSREAAVDAAHRAEVAAGTGLGDVFVQDRAGLAWNAGDGGGRNRIERDDRIEYVSTGGIATESVLGDEASMARVADAGTDALRSFDPEDSLEEWFETAWTFARRTGLPTPAVRETVERVTEAGGAATMAMVGETVLAAGVEGVLPEETRITNEGAHLVDRA